MAATMMDGKRSRRRCGRRSPTFAAGHVGLATILVGDDPASDVYIRLKQKAAEEAGIDATDHRLPADTSEDVVRALIETLNADDAVDGILVQSPLPPHLDEAALQQLVDPAKDVDGFHVQNAGSLYLGRPGPAPRRWACCGSSRSTRFRSRCGRSSSAGARSSASRSRCCSCTRNATVTIHHDGRISPATRSTRTSSSRPSASPV